MVFSAAFGRLLRRLLLGFEPAILSFFFILWSFGSEKQEHFAQRQSTCIRSPTSTPWPRSAPLAERSSDSMSLPCQHGSIVTSTWSTSTTQARICKEEYVQDIPFQVNNDRYTNSPNQITASMSAGSFIGALCAGFIADKWGRRYALMTAAVVWVIGAAIQCSSQNVGHLIAGRIISGLSVGVTSSQVCVYLAELAPGRIRGRIVGIQQWAIEWGILIMFLIAYGCTSVAGPAAFRIAWGVQAVPGFVLFGALIFFPESPRWLAGQERWEECLGVLAAIHAKGNRDDPIVQAEYLEVQEAVRVMQEAKGVGFLELFGPKVWKVSVRFEPSLGIH